EQRRLLRHRHVQAKRRPAGIVERQGLVCLDGAALQVTPAFRELWPDTVPPFLTKHEAETRSIALPDGSRGLLVRRHYRPLGNDWTSPERLRMSLLNRLQRFGIEAPRVLAVGERPLPGGDTTAFLLTRLPVATSPLKEWLGQHPELAERVALVRELGATLSRM